MCIRRSPDNRAPEEENLFEDKNRELSVLTGGKSIETVLKSHRFPPPPPPAAEELTDTVFIDTQSMGSRIRPRE